MSLDLVWKRPDNIAPFPHVWLEFIAKESKHSTRLLKYRIQDLPEDRFDDAFEHIKKCFLPYAPISKFFGASTNDVYAEDYLRSCRRQMQTKTSLACFREDTDDIVGLNITYVATKNDPFWQEARELAQSQEYKEHMKIAEICRANVNMFEKYNVDKYLGCICMSVAPQYQGLSIGQRLLEARKPFCETFGIEVTQSFFSSDYSNRIADKVGFVVDSEYTMDELSRIYPNIPFNQIEATKLSMKSWNFK